MYVEEIKEKPACTKQITADAGGFFSIGFC